MPDLPEQKKPHDSLPSDEADIIELDDRLDLAFDPLSVAGSDSDFFSNPNCNNGTCCNGS